MVIKPAKLARSRIRVLLRRYSPQLLYPVPTSSLYPERLYAYLDALWQRRSMDGAIVEIGCWLGGTSAIASTMLTRTGHRHRYVAIDTFDGFVPEQFAHDQMLGVPANDRVMFSKNSLEMVRRLLDCWGAPGVELMQADIASLDSDRLPERIAVCLVDVDLEIPVYEALRRVFPRLESGGIILVDDCPDRTTWAGARIGYARFIREIEADEQYSMGMGVLSH
jgi:hypothetical protein